MHTRYRSDLLLKVRANIIDKHMAGSKRFKAKIYSIQIIFANTRLWCLQSYFDDNYVGLHPVVSSVRRSAKNVLGTIHRVDAFAVVASRSLSGRRYDNIM